MVCIDATIRMDDLPQHFLNYFASEDHASPAGKLPLEDAEMQTMLSCLEKNGYNRTQTARELGISRNTLWRKMRRYGISSVTSWHG